MPDHGPSRAVGSMGLLRLVGSMGLLRLVGSMGLLRIVGSMGLVWPTHLWVLYGPLMGRRRAFNGNRTFYGLTITGR